MLAESGRYQWGALRCACGCHYEEQLEQLPPGAEVQPAVSNKVLLGSRWNLEEKENGNVERVAEVGLITREEKGE